MPSRLGCLLAATLFILVAGCDVEFTSETDTLGDDDGLEEVKVLRVVDGDTIIVLRDGREERLRYIGIDAPESVDPDRPTECYGPESKEENTRLVSGEDVFLEADEEERDRFGRLLRYVYISGPDSNLVMVNEALVAKGFAEAGSFPPNERYSDELFAAERLAQASGAGLWSACF